MRRYLQIFAFLWRLKRVDHDLNTTWNNHMTEQHKLRNFCKDFPDVQHVLHVSHLLRSEMLYFTSILHSYLMFEVLETAWEELVRELSSARPSHERTRRSPAESCG